MKCYAYYIIFFISIHFGAISQNGNAYYTKKTRGEDSLRSSNTYLKIDNNVKNALASVDNTLSSFKYILRFSSDLADYEKIKNIDDSSFKNKFSNAFSGFSGKVYFNRITKSIILSSDITGKVFFVTKKFNEIKWKLTKEKIIINDLTCYKATTTISEEGRRGIKKIDVIAWYTPEINIPYGPDGFGGLPGLIIQLEKGRIITSLQQIEFVEKKNKHYDTK